MFNQRKQWPFPIVEGDIVDAAELMQRLVLFRVFRVFRGRIAVFRINLEKAVIHEIHEKHEKIQRTKNREQKPDG